MRPAARWLSLAVALNVVAPASLFVPRDAMAQGKKPKSLRDELPADLRKDWDAALTLFGDGNFRGAAVQFQRVYDATKNPRILVNIGRAYQEDKKAPKALAFYQRALAEGATVLAANDVKDINIAISQLRELVTSLEVQATEAGATVTVDGEDVGKTPLAKPVDVALGDHDIGVTKDGFKPQTRRVTAARGTPLVAKFELQAERPMALVTITAEGAPKAMIRIDGVEMGAAPYKGNVEVGKAHKFEAVAPGYVPAEQNTVVDKGDPFSVVLRLSQARSEGRLAIIARPAGAIIQVDDKILGTDKWEGPLPAGGHMVLIRKEGYVSFQQEIGIATDQVRTVETELRQDTSKGALYWAIGTILVVGGGAAAAYLVAKQGREDPAVPGNLIPGGVTTTWWRR